MLPRSASLLFSRSFCVSSKIVTRHIHSLALASSTLKPGSLCHNSSLLPASSIYSNQILLFSSCPTSSQQPQSQPESQPQQALQQPIAAVEAAVNVAEIPESIKTTVPSAPAAAMAYWGKVYFELGKTRLSALVVVTAGAGYVVSSAGLPMSPVTFGFLATGTFLGAACANAINQCMEHRNDSQMFRTRGRPLPSGRITLNHALFAAATSGITGVGILAVTINPLTAALCLTNIGLYTLIYTPMKQKHHWNTWVGALVGAIPPMMGWTAAVGSLEPGAFVLAALLFVWQLPHFMSLAYLLRDDYMRGGYRMLPSFDIQKTVDVIKRNCVYLFPITIAAPVLGISEWMFAGEATVLNLIFFALSHQFSKEQNTNNAKRLFLFSLAYLPVLLGFLVFHRQSASPRDFVCPHDAVQVEALAKQTEQPAEEKK